MSRSTLDGKEHRGHGICVLPGVSFRPAETNTLNLSLDAGLAAATGERRILGAGRQKLSWRDAAIEVRGVEVKRRGTIVMLILHSSG
jgi:hypothetical protein